jgi:hypothetical protein
MRKLWLLLLVMFAVSGLSLAAGPQGIHEPGTGLADPEAKEAGQGSGQGMMAGSQGNNTMAQEGVHEPGTGLANPELKEAAQGSGQGTMAGGQGNKQSQQGVHEPGTGLANPELKEAAQGSGQGLEAKAENATTNEPTASATQAQPGFEAALAALGIIVASFGLLYRRH